MNSSYLEFNFDKLQLYEYKSSLSLPRFSESFRAISNGPINLTAMAYAKNDPACCPTLKGKPWYKLALGKLIPVKSRRQQTPARVFPQRAPLNEQRRALLNRHVLTDDQSRRPRTDRENRRRDRDTHRRPTGRLQRLRID